MQRYKWSYESFTSKVCLLSHYNFFSLLSVEFCTADADRQMNHRIESFRLENTFKIVNYKPNSKSPPLNCVPKCCVYMSFKCPGQPVLSNLNLLWNNLRSFSSCPVTGYLGRKEEPPPGSTPLSGSCRKR